MEDTRIFLIGGANLFAKGLKEISDYDFVVLNRHDFENLVSALKAMGFVSMNDSRISPINTILPITDWLSHDAHKPVNIFELIIKNNACYISQRMIERTTFRREGKAVLGLLHNNDIFLLKAMAARDKDFPDLKLISRQQDFDYQTVYKEMAKQEHETGHNLCSSLFDSIVYFMSQGNQKPPFYQKLFRRMLDRVIEEKVRQGAIPLEALIDELEDEIVTAHMIRKRVNALGRKKRIGITSRDGALKLRPRDGNVLNVELKRFKPTSKEACESHIQRIIQSTCLYMPEDISSQSKTTLIRLMKKSLHEGHKSEIVAAAVVYFALRESGRKYFSRAEIAKAAKVSNTSLGHYLEKIGPKMEH